MNITIRIKGLSNFELKRMIQELDSKGLMDWDYFWEFATIDEPIEYLIGFFEDKVDWYLLSKNENIEWTDRRVSLFSDSLDFSNLSSNKNLACTPEGIEKFAGKWQWGYRGSGGKLASYSVEGLSANPRLPLDVPFLQRNQRFIDFRSLGQNPSLFFKDIGNYHPESFDDYIAIYSKTYDILDCFEDKWCMTGSFWDDGDFAGHAKDSILHNPEIDWKHFLEVKERRQRKNDVEISYRGDDLPF
jgi:hypothetical protein